MGKLCFSFVLVLAFSELRGTLNGNLVAAAIQVVYPISSPDIGLIGFQNAYDILDYAIDLGPYGLQVEIMDSFVFQVKSCRDTSVYLSNSPHLDSTLPFYNIYLGGATNSWSAIRVRNLSLNETFFVNGVHLDCLEFRTFWISWVNGLVQFGKGNDVGYNILKEWQDTEPFPVMGMGISTGYGGVGEWKIPATISDNFNGFYNGCQRINMRASSLITSSTTKSILRCALLCSSDSECIGFNYSKSDRRCELISPQGSNLTALPLMELVGWQSLFKCYTGAQVCIGCFF